MRITQNTLLVATLTLISVTACSQEGANSEAASLGSARVAVVNGQPVAESVLRMYALTTERKNLEEMSPEDRERVLDDLIGLQLLAQQATKDGLTSSRTLAAQVELQRLRLVANAMATDYIEKNPPSDADIQAIYDENLPLLVGRAVQGASYPRRHQRGSRKRNRPAAARS